MAEFLAAGGRNDDVESMRVVGAGCAVWIYEHGNLHHSGGWSAFFGAGSYDGTALVNMGA